MKKILYLALYSSIQFKSQKASEKYLPLAKIGLSFIVGWIIGNEIGYASFIKEYNNKKREIIAETFAQLDSVSKELDLDKKLETEVKFPQTTEQREQINKKNESVFDKFIIEENLLNNEFTLKKEGRCLLKINYKEIEEETRIELFFEERIIREAVVIIDNQVLSEHRKKHNPTSDKHSICRLLLSKEYMNNSTIRDYVLHTNKIKR